MNSGDKWNHQAKRPRFELAQDIGTITRPLDKRIFVENWLEESSWSRKAFPKNQSHLLKTVIKMPRKGAGPPLLAQDDSLGSTALAPRTSSKSAASVHDVYYRDSLHLRNISIEKEDPPPELMRRAQRIISRSRASTEMDDATVEKLKRLSRSLQGGDEDMIIDRLVPKIIPAMSRVPDQRLENRRNQPWSNSVPVPLNARVLRIPLPLSKPKPDLIFGYSRAAFTEDQLMTIDLLVDDQFGRSYATPERNIRFPFLQVEFKSQAKTGTHFVATNQVAGAGAIALQGTMNLIQRSSGMKDFDYDQPQYFSITMDHELARINVHWLKAPTRGGQTSFHVETLAWHIIRDANGIRAVSRAVKNILDYGTEARLPMFCSALDAYREVVLRNEAANHPAKQGLEASPKPTRRTGGTSTALIASMESDTSCKIEADPAWSRMFLVAQTWWSTIRGRKS